MVAVEGGQLLFVAGQVALDRNGNIVGDDIGEQARQVFRNVRAALEACQASPRDIVRLTTYVVGEAFKHPKTLEEARSEILELEELPATTLVGVTSLAMEGLLVEVEAVALVD